jgi:hypothetical protein
MMVSLKYQAEDVVVALKRTTINFMCKFDKF